MPDPREPSQELASTYFVQDRTNRDEMARLELQDMMLTSGMGGVLPELPDPTLVRRILDVGCGTGGWLRQTAREYPTIEKLVGVDISHQMIAYACAQAEAEQLDDRVTFQTMDALRILEFPAGSFDLVNQRLGVSWIRTWEWTKLLLEYQRVTKPGGIIRITEMNVLIENNSPALSKVFAIGFQALYNSGRLFEQSSDGVTSELERLLIQHGLQDVKSRVHSLVFRAGTDAHQRFCANLSTMLRLTSPFTRKWTSVPDNYQEIVEQAMREVHNPDFVATWTLLTTWGTRAEGKPPLMRGLL